MNDDQITRAFAELREAAEHVDLPGPPPARTASATPWRRFAVPLAAAALAVVLLGSALVAGLVRGSGSPEPAAPDPTAPPTPSATSGPSDPSSPTPSTPPSGGPATRTPVTHLGARVLPDPAPFRWVATYDGAGWGAPEPRPLCGQKPLPLPEGGRVSSRVFEQYESADVKAVETPVVLDHAVSYPNRDQAGTAYQAVFDHLADCPPVEDLPGSESRVEVVADGEAGAIFELQSVTDGSIVRPTRQVVLSTSGTTLRLTILGAGDALDMDDAVARRVLREQ